MNKRQFIHGFTLAKTVLKSINMKIKLLQSVVIKGVPGVSAGDVFELADDVGRDVVSQGLAEEIKGQPPAALSSPDPVVEHRDPVVEETPRQKSVSRKPAKT